LAVFWETFHGAIEGLTVNLQISHSSDFICRIFIHLPSTFFPRTPYLINELTIQLYQPNKPNLIPHGGRKDCRSGTELAAA
jgi:hypothetical protein